MLKIVLAPLVSSPTISSSETAKHRGRTVQSRAQLEEEIKALSKQIQAAISSKDFGKASALQQSLDEKEGMLNVLRSGP